MKPRITVNISEGGQLEIWLNPEGRDLLVRELQRLGEISDHFHLGAEALDREVPLQTVPYRNDDQPIESGKVIFRPDSWIAEYFPHVLRS